MVLGNGLISSKPHTVLEGPAAKSHAQEIHSRSVTGKVEVGGPELVRHLADRWERVCRRERPFEPRRVVESTDDRGNGAPTSESAFVRSSVYRKLCRFVCRHCRRQRTPGRVHQKSRSPGASRGLRRLGGRRESRTVGLSHHGIARVRRAAPGTWRSARRAGQGFPVLGRYCRANPDGVRNIREKESPKSARIATPTAAVKEPKRAFKKSLPGIGGRITAGLRLPAILEKGIVPVEGSVQGRARQWAVVKSRV